MLASTRSDLQWLTSTRSSRAGTCSRGLLEQITTSEEVTLLIYSAPVSYAWRLPQERFRSAKAIFLSSFATSV